MKEKEIQSLIHNTKKLVLYTIKKYIQPQTIPYIDDIVQETYIKLIKSLQSNQFLYKSKLSTYLYKIAKNETIKYNEKIQKEEQKKEKIKELWKITKSFFYKDRNSESFLKEQILTEKEYLSDIQKEILDLYLKGYRQKEIAKMLRLQLGTVKSNIFRIKNKIKKNEMF